MLVLPEGQQNQAQGGDDVPGGHETPEAEVAPQQQKVGKGARGRPRGAKGAKSADRQAQLRVVDGQLKVTKSVIKL